MVSLIDKYSSRWFIDFSMIVAFVYKPNPLEFIIVLPGYCIELDSLKEFNDLKSKWYKELLERKKNATLDR